MRKFSSFFRFHDTAKLRIKILYSIFCFCKTFFGLIWLGVHEALCTNITLGWGVWLSCVPLVCHCQTFLFPRKGKLSPTQSQVLLRFCQFLMEFLRHFFEEKQKEHLPVLPKRQTHAIFAIEV